MEEMDVDEFLDIVIALREDVKLLKKRIRRLEVDADIDEEGEWVDDLEVRDASWREGLHGND